MNPVRFPIHSGNAPTRGQPITSLDDWRRLAPPRLRHHWQPRHSALELARHWVGGQLPVDVAHALQSHAALKSFRPKEAFARLETRFDAHPRGREHDLIVFGSIGRAPAVLDVEGKVTETYGELVRSALEKARRAPGSYIPGRMERLSRAILGRPVEGSVLDLRYQLLYGVASTLVQAARTNARKAIFLAHVFNRHTASPQLYERNDEELCEFLQHLGRRSWRLKSPAEITGPFTVPGDTSVDEFRIDPGVELYIGRVVTSLLPAASLEPVVAHDA